MAPSSCMTRRRKMHLSNRKPMATTRMAIRKRIAPARNTVLKYTSTSQSIQETKSSIRCRTGSCPTNGSMHMHSRPIIVIWQLSQRMEVYVSLITWKKSMFLPFTSIDVFCWHIRLLDLYSSYYGGFQCVCWSPDGKYVITGGQDDLLSIWSVTESAIVARCQGHQSWVTDVVFDPWRCDERNYRFGSVGEDGRLLLWDFSVGMLHRPKAVR